MDCAAATHLKAGTKCSPVAEGRYTAVQAAAESEEHDGATPRHENLKNWHVPFP